MLTLIPTPLGNIYDITYRAIETLQSIDVILCEDTRVTKQLLRLLQERFSVTFPNFEIISFHEHNQEAKIDSLKEILQNKKVAYLSDAGMPAISDPGQLLVSFCQDNNIEYDVLAGASVPPMLYAASGFESGKFTFYGFLAKKGKERQEELRAILESSYDTIIYEAPHRILKLLEEINILDEQRELFLAKELTKKYQRYFRGSAKELLEELKNSSTKGEWAVVIKANAKLAEQKSLSLSEIEALDIPPKVKAKLIAKITGQSVKECYNKLLK
jgi:16S rRNA (cytidine1402-2'-O)-methyltransferase